MNTARSRAESVVVWIFIESFHEHVVWRSSFNSDHDSRLPIALAIAGWNNETSKHKPYQRFQITGWRTIKRFLPCQPGVPAMMTSRTCFSMWYIVQQLTIQFSFVRHEQKDGCWYWRRTCFLIRPPRPTYTGIGN